MYYTIMSSQNIQIEKYIYSFIFLLLPMVPRVLRSPLFSTPTKKKAPVNKAV